MLLTAFAWYLSQVLSFVLHEATASCPRGFYADEVRVATFRCGLTPPLSVCPGPMGCDDDRPDPMLYGVLLCPTGQRVVHVGDGHTVACRRAS
jgi:hypothetical protein